ncbi:unnamed protein product, partial [Linum tenue]
YQILAKNQLQRFLGSLNYILDFYPNINILCKPLHNRLKKSPPPWSDQHTEIVLQIKRQVQSLPCLHISDPSPSKFVETDASDLRYGGILKQIQNDKELLVFFTSKHRNPIKINYSTVKKKYCLLLFYASQNFSMICSIKSFYYALIVNHQNTFWKKCSKFRF